MNLIYDYNGIFEKTIEILKRQYSTSEGVTSISFEQSVNDILTEAIEEWNKTLPAGQQVEIKPEYHGGKKFPDYSLENKTYNERVGIEVKHHDSSEQWVIPGNSAIASTQIQGLATIYVLFGHFKMNPPDFRILPMEKCIYQIETTHNPRYKLDMSANRDFCSEELGISYETLRNLDQKQREIIINSYVARNEFVELKDRGDKKSILARCFILFPEVFSSEQTKYKRMGRWLFANDILCYNVRDAISAKGRVKICDNENELFNGVRLPRIFYNLFLCRREFKEELRSLHSSVIAQAWNCDIAASDDFDKRLDIWLDLTANYFGGSDRVIKDTGEPFHKVIRGILEL